MDSELCNLRKRLESLEEDKRYLSKELEKWRQSAQGRAQLIEEIQNDPWVRLGSRLRLIKRRDVAPATLEMTTLSEAGASAASGRDQDAYPKWELRTDEGSEAHLIYPREDHEMVRVAIIKAKARTDWGIQLNRRGLKVSSGERYAVVFRARSARPGTIGLGFAKADAPWSSLGLYAELRLNPEWQTFRQEFVALEDEDNARIHFDLGKNKVGMDLTFVSVQLVKSAQAAGGGAKQERNLGEAAAASESVVRDFLQSAQAAGGSAKQERNLDEAAAASESVVRDFLQRPGVPDVEAEGEHRRQSA